MQLERSIDGVRRKYGAKKLMGREGVRTPHSVMFGEKMPGRYHMHRLQIDGGD